MALQDIVNNYNNKKKGANSFLPTNEQDLDTQADVSPIAPEIKNEQTAQENREAASSNAMPTVKYPNKPEAMSDGDYEHLMSVGFSPDAISNYTAPYDPATNGNYLQRIFESSVSKPSAPDEKKMRGARIVSGIGDALGLISQMWSAGKGAYMKERDYESSALGRTEGKEKELRNIYLQQQNKYNDGLYNARLKDFLKGLDDYNNGKKNIQGVLAAKQKLDQTGEQFKEKQRYAYDKLAQDKDKADQANQLARDKFGESVRHNKAMESQGWARVQDAKNRTSAYVKNISSGGKNGYQMIIEANPQDNQAQTDNQLGSKVRVFEMNKGEVDRWAREALNDTGFMAMHPELVTQKPDILGNGQTKYKPVQDIAAAYLKEQYEKQFDPDPSVPSSMPMIDWSRMMNQGVPDWNQMLNGNTPETEEADEWGQFEISGF
ncbi:MAG: hypothetical protein QM660_08800 [Dysgonomonas sp.]